MTYARETFPVYDDSTVLAALDTAQARAEIRAIIESGVLGASSRQVRLLEFLFDELVHGRAAELKEYTVALEVFGRSPDFDQHRDAIVRVEAHRLRKKLRKYYETVGKYSAVRVTLPPGTYVLSVEKVRKAGSAAGGRRAPWWWRFETALVLGALLAAFGTWLIWLNLSASTQPVVPAAGLAPGESRAGAAALPEPTAVADPEPGAVRILAGRLDGGYQDPSGRRWGRDRFFDGGESRRSARQVLDRTGRPGLFEYAREGTSRYRIPLAPGDYELHLYFSNPDGPEAAADPSRRFRIMAVLANHSPILNPFDLGAEAGYAAEVRSFGPVRPAADGFLELLFYSARGPAVINAIEIVPMLNGAARPVRITAQPSPFIDNEGRYWAPDDFYSGGTVSPYRSMVAGARDPGIFAAERYGDFEYFVPVPPGQYKVTLYMAETWFGRQQYGKGGPGSRVFDVYLNRELALRELDLLALAQENELVTRAFPHVRPDQKGKIHLSFASRINHASLRALEVVPE